MSEQQETIGRDATRVGAKPGRTFAKFAVFIALALGIVVLLSAFLTPTFKINSRDNVRGIYAEPANSVQVVSLGVSTLRRGFSPDCLYENNGIRAFDACTDSQPMIASYYLLKDILRNQSESLSVVVLDVSSLTSNKNMINKVESAERVSSMMDLSPVKVEFALEMDREYDDATFYEQLIPVLKFHSRWSELESDDIQKLAWGDYSYTHGQPILSSSYSSNIARNRSGKFTTENNEGITEARESSEEDLEALLNEPSVRYFEKVEKLCRDNDIELLLVKVADSMWDDLHHDCISLFAQRHGLDFLDLSMPDAIESIQLDYDTDYYDKKHPNIVGSQKISRYLGDYLVSHYELDDVRGEGAYAYMDDDLEHFHENLDDARLMQCQSLDEYLDLLDEDRYAILVAVKGEAQQALDDETRMLLSELGFDGLAHLQANGSYVGVVARGRLLAEQVSEQGDEATLKGTGSGGVLQFGGERADCPTSIGSDIVLSSVGSDKGARASILVDGEECAREMDGINFVVYSCDGGVPLDSSAFNTQEGLDRTNDPKPKG